MIGASGLEKNKMSDIFCETEGIVRYTDIMDLQNICENKNNSLLPLQQNNCSPVQSDWDTSWDNIEDYNGGNIWDLNTATLFPFQNDVVIDNNIYDNNSHALNPEPPHETPETDDCAQSDSVPDLCIRIGIETRPEVNYFVQNEFTETNDIEQIFNLPDCEIRYETEKIENVHISSTVDSEDNQIREFNQILNKKLGGLSIHRLLETNTKSDCIQDDICGSLPCKANSRPNPYINSWRSQKKETHKRSSITVTATEHRNTGSELPTSPVEKVSQKATLQRLGCKIRTRRIQEGKGEYVSYFTPPPVIEPTEEEKKKAEDLKDRNRQSANKSRENFKTRVKELKEDISSWEQTNKQLQAEINQLKSELEDRKSWMRASGLATHV